MIAQDLWFPNGIVLSKTGRSLWVAESNRFRILDIGIDDGSTRVLLDQLPGTPDNINTSPDGTTLIALYDRVAALDNLILPFTLSRNVAARLPVSLFVNEDDPPGGSVLQLDSFGKVVRHHTGLRPAATSVVPTQDGWYLGALLSQPVRRVDRP